MRNLVTVIFILALFGCANNNKDCKVFHQEIIPIGENKQVIRVVNDCNKQTAYSYEVIRVSQDSFIYNGAYKDFYNNGKLKTLSYFKNNFPDSVTIKYRENGKMEFRNYFVKGQRVGIQEIFYPNGNLNEINYHKNDSEIIFRVKFKENNVIDSIIGQLFRVDLNKSIREFKLGDKLNIINELIVLEGFRTILSVKVKSSKKEFLNMDYTDFYHLDNRHYKGLFFNLEKRGMLNYSAKVCLIDNKTGLTVKTDSNSFDIMVR